jgi:hypothetical protein
VAVTKTLVVELPEVVPRWATSVMGPEDLENSQRTEPEDRTVSVIVPFFWVV